MKVAVLVVASLLLLPASAFFIWPLLLSFPEENRPWVFAFLLIEFVWIGLWAPRFIDWYSFKRGLEE